MKVVIDGVDYTPRETVIPARVYQLLSQLHGIVWTEAHYDPTNERTKEFALRLSPLMQELNQFLKFKK